MKIKAEAILQFTRYPLKHPMSRQVLEFLVSQPALLQRITFVHNREYLPNTLLISEMGSRRVGFELELGARRLEEVSIVNGQLVKHTRRDRALCINEPAEALQALREFKGRLYVVFAFAGKSPAWYDAVVEPNPNMPVQPDAQASIDTMLGEIIKEQIELALYAIMLRDRIEKALVARDRALFAETVPIYREIVQRCLWDF